MKAKGYFKDVVLIWAKFALLLLPAGLALCFAFNVYHRELSGSARYDLFQVAKVIVIGLIPAAFIFAGLIPRAKQ